MRKSLLLIMVLLVAYPAGSSAFELKWFGKSKTGKKKNAEKIYRQALSAYGTASYSKAIELSSKAVKQDAKFSKAYLLRGKARKDMGDIDAAIKDLNRAIELNKKLGEAYYVRGFTYEILGEMDKAKADYKKGCSAGYRDACQ